MAERTLGDLLAIDERAIARSLIANDVRPIGDGYLRMVARDVAAGEAEIILAATADGEKRLVDRDDAATQPVVDFEACS